MSDITDALTLEKLKIHERLASIETKLDAFLDGHKKHSEIIFGNGDEGLKLKIDRLEVDYESRKWHFRTLWAVVIGIIGNLIFTFFKK